jgi:hypothetical protein
MTEIKEEKRMRQYLKTALVAVIFVFSLSLAVPTSGVSALENTQYSCGTYGSGNYSTGGTCSNNDNITAPNTGFAAQLLQPNNLIPLIASVLAIAVGATLLLKKHKKAKS